MTKEKIKKFTKENWFKIMFVLIFLMIGFSVFYYFFLRPYQNDRPYRECLKRIDPDANFRDVEYDYADCVKFFK